MTERKLPDGWRWVRFGDVVREVKDTTKDPEADGLERVVGLGHLDPESLPLRRWDELSELGDGTSFTRIFRAGQVLFGKRRAYQRKVAVADFDGVCSSDILVFEPSSEQLLPEFLPYLVQSDGFFDHALDTSAGSLSPRTKFKELAEYRCPLPPVGKQREVVELLNAASGVVDRLVNVKLGIAAIARSLIVKAESESRDWVPLGDVLVEPPRNGMTIQPTEEATGVWSLTVGSVDHGGYSPSGNKTIVPPYESDRFRVSEGDLFITRSNTIDRVGLPARISGSPDVPLYFSDLLMRLRPDETVVPAALLEQMLRGPRARSFIRSIAAGTSASMKKINARNLQRLPIAVLPEAAASDLLPQLVALRELGNAYTAHLSNAMRLGRDARERILRGERAK